MSNAAVFLDRDNTLIVNDGDLGDPEKVELIKGAASAIASLRGLGYRIIVVTNQGGVARGKYTEEDVEQVHRRVNEMIHAVSGAKVDRFYFCPYHPEATVEKYRSEHEWRKPAPGMLLQAAEDLSIDLGQSWMVGDQMRDVEAGAAAGTRTILLRDDAQPLTPLKMDEIQSMRFEDAGEAGPMVPTFTARSLVEAARIIAQQRKPETAEDVREIDGERKKWDANAVRAARVAKTGGGDPPKTSSVSAPESARTDTPMRRARPFRPWNAPSPQAEAEQTPYLPVQSPMAAAPAPVIEEPAVVEVPVPTPPVEQAAPTPTPMPTPESVDEAAEAAAIAERAAEVRILEVQEVEAEIPAPAPPAAMSPAGMDTNLLKQILHEMRAQRGAGSEFAYTKMIAVVLQMIAIVCLIGAFWMSDGGKDSTLFFQGMAAAILVQLGTVSMLLFGRN